MGLRQVAIQAGKRVTTANALLRPAMKRPNLTVMTDAQVTRVVLEGKRAVGIEARTPQGLVTVRARREVVLSAGAIQSPQLLMLSGIGDSEHLASVGVEVRHHLPGVGRNLHDHLASPVHMAMDDLDVLRHLAASHAAQSAQHPRIRGVPVGAAAPRWASGRRPTSRSYAPSCASAARSSITLSNQLAAVEARSEQAGTQSKQVEDALAQANMQLGKLQAELRAAGHGAGPRAESDVDVRRVEVEQLTSTVDGAVDPARGGAREIEQREAERAELQRQLEEAATTRDGLRRQLRDRGDSRSIGSRALRTAHSLELLAAAPRAGGRDRGGRSDRAWRGRWPTAEETANWPESCAPRAPRLPANRRWLP